MDEENYDSDFDYEKSSESPDEEDKQTYVSNEGVSNAIGDISDISEEEEHEKIQHN